MAQKKADPTAKSEKKSAQRGLYLPDFDRYARMAASLGGKRGRPLPAGTLVREIMDKVAEFYEKNGHLPWEKKS